MINAKHLSCASMKNRRAWACFVGKIGSIFLDSFCFVFLIKKKNEVGSGAKPQVMCPFGLIQKNEKIKTVDFFPVFLILVMASKPKP